MRRLLDYRHAREFQRDVWPLLLEREAENNLVIGLAGQQAQRRPAQVGPGTSAPRFWAVASERAVIAAAMMTPPHRIVLTRMDAATTDFLADSLQRAGARVPGVVGPKETARRFADAWTRQAGQTVRSVHAMRIYQLDAVKSVGSVTGGLQRVGVDGLDWVCRWGEEFAVETGTLPASPRAEVRNRLRQGEIVAWHDPTPVALAAATGPTPNGIRINLVYTPPANRGRGYATALVAALSARLLAGGRRFCFLFTDLANPTSNSIYQKIGYRPVCDFSEFDFVDPRDAAAGLTVTVSC